MVDGADFLSQDGLGGAGGGAGHPVDLWHLLVTEKLLLGGCCSSSPQQPSSGGGHNMAGRSWTAWQTTALERTQSEGQEKRINEREASGNMIKRGHNCITSTFKKKKKEAAKDLYILCFL